MPYRHNQIARIAFIVFFLLIVIYAYFEARNILLGPEIIFGAAQVRTISDQYIVVSGIAKNIATIHMNGRTLSVTEKGAFEEPLLLSEGYNRIIFEAEDKFGRSTKETLEIVYTPEHTDTATTTPSNTSL